MTTTYKIGEAAALLNLKTYVLRFWETEFPDIAPLRTEKGQRLYTEEHIALLERIRYLLHDRGLTIGGARKALAEEKERGLMYAFNAPGGLARPSVFPVRDDSRPAGEDYSEPADDAGNETVSERAFDDPEGSAIPDEPIGGKDALKVGGLSTASSIDDSLFLVPPVARPFADTGSPRQPGQYNLPGLEELIAMRAAVLDSQAGAEYGVMEESGEEPLAEEEANQGMLPLFAASGAAGVMGRTPDGTRSLPERGGGNFIQTGGAPSGGTVPAGTARGGDASGWPPEAGGVADSNASLRDILLELEAVAAILRRNGPERADPVSATSPHST